MSKTTEYEITKKTEYLTSTKRDQQTPGIFVMRLIHAQHIFKIFLRCMHILKNFSRLFFFFMNVIIQETQGNRIQWRVAELYQVCYKICEICIETYKINREISSLLFHTLKAVLETEVFFKKYNVHFVQWILNNTGMQYNIFILDQPKKLTLPPF